MAKASGCLAAALRDLNQGESPSRGFEKHEGRQTGVQSSLFAPSDGTAIKTSALPGDTTAGLEVKGPPLAGQMVHLRRP